MVKSKAPSSIMEFMKIGFGVGIGSRLAGIIFIFIAMIFFIPGFILLLKEKEKPKTEQSNTIKIFAFVLMMIGSIIGIGMGFNSILSLLAEEL